MAAGFGFAVGSAAVVVVAAEFASTDFAVRVGRVGCSTVQTASRLVVLMMVLRIVPLKAAQLLRIVVAVGFESAGSLAVDCRPPEECPTWTAPW